MKNTELIRTVKDIFEDNTNYTIPIHAVNQADSITALSVDLYTDANRFIYELLQNADDSVFDDNGVKVWIKIFNDNLVVAHSGKVFDTRDIRGICNINNGTKKSDLKKTGYKGIGFKSVFGQSDYVVIYSDGEFFRFDKNYAFEWRWEKSKKEWEKDNNRKFEYPWQIIPIYTEDTEISEQIRDYIFEVGANVATILKINYIQETIDAIRVLTENSNMFLFLKHITEIIIEDKVIKINRNIKNRLILRDDTNSQKEWIIKNINLNVPEDLNKSLLEERNIPQKLLEANNIDMIFAAKIVENQIKVLEKEDRLLYSYLPTGETKYAIPVLVNTSFLISANRESIHKDSKWNQWLFESISYEIFKWISELIKTEISFEAYKLIPEKTAYSDGLANSFNNGIDKAKEEIAFILSRKNTMIKIGEALIDFTHLSEKTFIDEESIKNFVATQNANMGTLFYVEKCGFWSELKKLGVSSFEWGNFKEFLNSKYFKETHSIQRNIDLIKFLRVCYESKKVKEVTKKYVCNLPFIWDHKNHINYPKQVCFPAVDDEEWNNLESELSFVHEDILNWLLGDLEIKNWLESLGVKEKTDITYISQMIIPCVRDYINLENAITAIQKLYSLYKKGDLKGDLLKELSEIKLLTTKNSLLQASKCYLSNFYKPRLEIEEVLDEDMFVSECYCQNNLEKDEWKRFFKILGVSEGTSILVYKDKNNKSSLMNSEINYNYFDEIFLKTHLPYPGFSVDSIGNIVSINHIRFIENNYHLALKFWKDYIDSPISEDIRLTARGYWGYSGMDGQTNGVEVENYISWFIRKIACIPTLSQELYISSEVFLNINEISTIADKYLPVFNGPELSQDWRTFFNFKTQLKLKDYLLVLERISLDIKENGEVKEENYERIQSIYLFLLDSCLNWSNDDAKLVSLWSKDNLLLSSKGTFIKCGGLHYFIDGNESIFQDQYNFIKLNAKNKVHSNLRTMLNHFKVKILSQNQFNLKHDDLEKCDDLKNKLKNIAPYLKSWIRHDDKDNNVSWELVQKKMNDLEANQSKKLKITYDELDFVKAVNIHFDGNTLYVTKPWYSNSVLLKLSEMLCVYLGLEGSNNKLDFLLRSEINEIQDYFLQEGIEIPLECNIDKSDKEISQYYDAPNNDKNNDFFEASENDPQKREYIKSLIPRSVKNILNHLRTLPEYDCTYADVISESVIDGITKNGNDIKVVARPSDNDKIRLYYDSEFDVLEYVDSELWYEDGITPPKQFTLGQLLKMKEINKIPIKQMSIGNIEFNNPKSDTLDFDAIPFSPEKTARIISSFANTDGGTILFGVKEISSKENKIVGLSTDFNVIEMTRKAISMLKPTPDVTYDWIEKDKKFVFAIDVRKSNEDICLNNQKYIRESITTKMVSTNFVNRQTINNPQFNKTIAIIIAIENYTQRKNQVQSVKYAINDALRFKEMLISSIGVDQKDIHEYKNEEALKSTLEYEFKNLFHSLTENDRLIFYYVGHGFHDGVTNYLSTYDMHPYNVAETAVSLRKIFLDPLVKSKCKNALIFIDACAKAFKNDNERNNLTDINGEEFRIISSEFKCYSIFLSCNPGQSSYSSDELENGIWTYFLTKAITESDNEAVCKACDRKYITDRKLADYLSNHVSNYAKENYNWTQNPKTIFDSSYENVITEI